MDKIITIPFGYLLDWLYQFSGNYGLALIIFALVVQLVLLPITAKSKKSMMKMSRLTPKMQAIKEKYPNDQQKQNEAIQQLQREEGASLGCGGCLWSLVPMLILIPLYGVIRQPIQYMLHETQDVAKTICTTLGIDYDVNYYAEIVAISSSKLQEMGEAIQAALAAAGQSLSNPDTLKGLNFQFLGIDLGLIPEWQFWAWDSWTWARIGGALIPLLSAGQQIVSMKISQRMNNSVVTDKNGLEDKATAEKSQQNQSTKMMTWMMPIISLFIGFGVPAALSLYWLIGGLIRMIEDIILTKHYRKVYDAEDAERLKKHLAEEAALAEKERIRAERRAANPEGITENTSKKKMQQKKQKEDQAAKAAAKKEYDAKKGIVTEEAPKENKALSGIADRPYCKGRAYDPNRYSKKNTEE
ncbi:MAG: YidC/Oxa1 family membrane protein insertase [Oscillospiraceae bacterium]|nr:YidC/Oxa1 family membrane protein insertase [Oscillospiraceae bacterium]